MPNLERLEMFIQALESGEYKQGKERLTKILPDGTKEHCCLGVMCEVAIANGLEIETIAVSVGFEGEKNVLYGETGRRDFLPKEVQRWYGVNTNNFMIPVPCGDENCNSTHSATYANDMFGSDFQAIANGFRTLFNIPKNETSVSSENNENNES